MKKILSVSLLVAALLFVAGCAKPPEAEMQAANSAMEMLKTAEADVYAPAAAKAATDTLNAARAAKTEADGKFALFRSYKNAKALFASSETLAKTATEEATAEKERVRQQVADLLMRANEQIAMADSMLAKAPVGKGNKADIELIKNDVNALRNAYDGAQRDNEAGKYAVARPKLESLISRATSIQQEIAAASAKKK